jgi:hypothetical protein
MRALGLALRIAAVLAVAFGAGCLTPLGQQYLPDAVNSAANSMGGWEIVLVASVGVARLRPLPAAITGAVAFLLMLEGYSLVSELRGHADRSLFSFWGVVAIVGGPIIGLATAWLRNRRPALRIVAAVVLALPVLVETAYGLTIIRATTSPVWWIVEAALAVALVVIVSVRARRSKSAATRLE